MSGTSPPSDNVGSTEREREPSPAGGSAGKVGLLAAAGVVAVVALLFILVVHFASVEMIKAHFDKFVFGIFTAGLGMLVPLFISKDAGVTLPSREVAARRIPAGVAALLFVLAAVIWWGQWSEYLRLSGEYDAICSKRQGLAEVSGEKITLLRKAQEKQTEIANLWFVPKLPEDMPTCAL